MTFGKFSSDYLKRETLASQTALDIRFELIKKFAYNQMWHEFIWSRPVIKNMPMLHGPMHSFRVDSMYPQNFIQIDPRVSEILAVTSKMNAI